MNLLAKILVGILVLIVLGISVVLVNYYNWRGGKLDALQAGGTVVETAAGPIQYILKGERGPVRLFFHGTPGGYDAGPKAGDDYRLLIPSRAGYLSTPLTIGKSWEEQADAYAALLDTLGIKEPLSSGD